MGPARMFRESLTSRPGIRTAGQLLPVVRSKPESKGAHLGILMRKPGFRAVVRRTMSGGRTLKSSNPALVAPAQVTLQSSRTAP